MREVSVAVPSATCLLQSMLREHSVHEKVSFAPGDDMLHSRFQISKSLVASLALSVVMSTVAKAEWIYKKEEKAFGETTATAMALGDSSVAFVSCDGDGLRLSLATPEDWASATVAMNLLSPKIIISIDGAKPVRFDASLQENGVHKIVAITDDQDVAKEAATQLAAARKRIDIGVELAEKKFYASRLSAAGAKKITAVIDACADQAKADDKKEEQTPTNK